MSCLKRRIWHHCLATQWWRNIPRIETNQQMFLLDENRTRVPTVFWDWIPNQIKPLADPGGPPAPKIFFFKTMQFLGNYEQILGSGPPWGQNSAGPRDQNPGSAPVGPFHSTQDPETTNRPNTPRISKRLPIHIASFGVKSWSFPF